VTKHSVGIVGIGVCVLALSLAGCFKSSTSQGSSESISKSISAPFRSSSASSGGDGKESAYHHDVRDYAAHLGDGAVAPEVLQRDVGAIAEDYGIVDWESDDGTYFALGSGLARAGIGDARFQALAETLAGPHGRRLGLLYQGYAASRP
jgi:hypothetical protein